MLKKTVLVTGCSDGGLGAALSLAFHQSGWRVLATARNPAKMLGLKAAGVETLTLDVVSEESRSSCVATITELTGGSLDALINNAGGGLSMPIADLLVEEGKELFELNVWSLVSTINAFLPLLFKSKSGGLIVNHSSTSGVFSLPFHGAYSASKAAVIALSDSMRLELGPFGIKVIELRTAVVKSDFYANVAANHLSKKLPDNSIYQVAREAIEEVLSGVVDGQHVRDRGQNAAAWAKQVVADLSKKNPPAVISRGTGAWSVWLATWLPPRMLDSKIKQMVALDKVEEALKR